MSRLAQIHRATPAQIQKMARRLRRGELVAVPTETVYGLAADAFNAAACQQIFAVKGRPTTDPLIVHLASAADLAKVALPNAAAWKLAQEFWPGPLTLVLPKNPAVPSIVSAGLDSIAVRVPAHPVFRQLLRAAKTPLAAPSANPFGYISPTTAAHVRASLGEKISHILDGGPAKFGLESTILDLRDPRRPRLLRPGVITAAELSAALGQKIAEKTKAASSLEAADQAQIAPGALRSHYSPRTPLQLHARLNLKSARADSAYVFFRTPSRLDKNIFILKPTRDPRQAGRHLFALLRQLDAGQYRAIHVEQAPDTGVADAINDRLRRAAAK